MIEQVIEQTLQKSEMVSWNNSYSVGVSTIDEQHQELIKTTNALFVACLEGREVVGNSFKETVHMAVDYIRHHFKYEENLLTKISYPAIAEHKAQHELFVKKVLEEVAKFESGNRFAPNTFVRFLQEWILTHIAIHDKKYGLFCAKLRAEGKIIPLD